jgi:hypothetical protein
VAGRRACSCGCDLLDQITGWCQQPTGAPVLLVTGGGGTGKTRLGHEACVRMLVAGWDAGLADDQRRGGMASNRLQRPVLLLIDTVIAGGRFAGA